MGRLTVDVVLRAPERMNPLKDRELLLRDLAAPEVENLGVLGDTFQTIDLSNNSLVELSGFPNLTRLRTLLLSNNHISTLSPGVFRNLKGLETLVLDENRLSSLAELEKLARFTCLKHLSVMNNPVEKRLGSTNCRLFLVRLLPRLETLNHSRVKKRERVAAEKLFSSEKGQRLLELVRKQQDVILGEEEPETEAAEETALQREERRRALREAVQNATSQEELDRLTRVLESGGDLGVPAKRRRVERDEEETQRE